MRVGVTARTGRIGELRAFGNTDARLVGFEVRGREKSHVVGRDHRDPGFLTQRHAARDEGFIFGAAQALQLEVVAVAEQRLPLARHAHRLRLTAGDERATHVAIGGAGQGDQA